MFEVPEIDVTDIQLNIEKHILVDVREPHELFGPLGYIEGVLLQPLGDRLVHFLKSTSPVHSYVFICHSGHRSAYACEIAYAYGFRKVFNMKGGMVAWNRSLMNVE